MWECQLKPKALAVFCYLSFRGVALTEKEISDGVHLSRRVVTRNLAALRSAGVVDENNRLLDEARDPRGRYFTLPDEVFLLELSPGALSIYAYLLCREDRRTHQCHPSCRTIAGTTGLALNTVVKAVGILADKGLLAVARSRWFNEAGLKRNGNNVYTILPTRTAVEEYHQRQLRRAEADTARWRAQKLAVEGKAGERLGVAGAPSRPRPPAVRAVQGQGEGVPTPHEMGEVGSWAAQSPKPQEKQGRSALKSRR